MNPILEFYDKEVQKFKYKHYIIDEYRHQILFDILYRLIKDANENNLKYFLTGSVSSMFQFKKLYKTIKDIDLIIKKEDLPKWLNIIRSIDNGYYLFFYEKSSKEAIQNWNNSLKLIEKRIISFKHLSKCFIDLIHYDGNITHMSQNIKIDNLYINYLPSLKFIEKIPFHRPIDDQDIEFLLEFEDSREFLLQFPKNKDIYRNMAKW